MFRPGCSVPVEEAIRSLAAASSGRLPGSAGGVRPPTPFAPEAPVTALGGASNVRLLAVVGVPMAVDRAACLDNLQAFVAGWRSVIRCVDQAFCGSAGATWFMVVFLLWSLVGVLSGEVSSAQPACVSSVVLARLVKGIGRSRQCIGVRAFSD
jgi:hypothetical protein